MRSGAPGIPAILPCGSGFQYKVLLVINVHEVQTARWHARARESAIARLKNGRNIAGAELPCSDVQERSNDCPNHVLKKSIPRDAEDPLVLFSIPIRLRNRTHTIFDFSGCRTKRREVMSPQKEPGGFVDRTVVDRIGEWMDIAAFERTYRVCSPQTVLVCFRDCGTSRMKFGSDLFHLPYADLRRKQRIDASNHSACLHGTNRLNISDLSLSVDAGVGAPGPGHLDFMIEEF